MGGLLKLKGAGYVAVAVGVIGIVSSMVLVPMSAAAEPRSASSAIAELEVTEIPAVGVDGFTGVYGTAGTPDLSQPSDTDSGDFSDPDGVLSTTSRSTALRSPRPAGTPDPAN